MKFLKTLAYGAAFASLGNQVSATELEGYTMIEKIKLLQAVSSHFSERRTDMLEFFSDRELVEKLKHSKGITPDDPIVRDLQDIAFTWGVDEILALLVFVQGECGDQITNFELGDILGATGNLLTCIQDAFIGLITGCVGEISGFAEPLICLVDLGITESELNLIPTSEAQLSGNEANRRLFSGLKENEFRKITEEQKVQLLSMLTDKRVLQEESGSDSAGTFDQLFALFADSILSGIQVDEATCAAFFGSADSPGLLGCFSLLNDDFFAEIQEFVNNGFPSENCGTLAAITSLDDLTILNSPILDPFGMIPDVQFGDSSQEGMTVALDAFNTIFGQCDVLEAGAFSAALKNLN